MFRPNSCQDCMCREGNVQCVTKACPPLSCPIHEQVCDIMKYYTGLELSLHWIQLFYTCLTALYINRLVTLNWRECGLNFTSNLRLTSLASVRCRSRYSYYWLSRSSNYWCGLCLPQTICVCTILCLASEHLNFPYLTNTDHAYGGLWSSNVLWSPR